MKKERFKIVPASYLVAIKDGKALMLRRFNTGFQDGNYGLVSGHLEGKETFRQCMIREAKEEAGISFKEEDLEVVHVMHRREMFNPVEIRERVDIFIRVDEWEGQIKNMEPEKCDDLSWFPLNNLPENAIPYIKFALECIDKNVFYSEWGWKTSGSKGKQ
ncbi:MAG: NUDIX domain-containing protein [Candidatus Moranbacteria bacterium]|nr:NUDIX domain-containing protein [Candidatus Moranbacteria bacterium]